MKRPTTITKIRKQIITVFLICTMLFIYGTVALAANAKQTGEEIFPMDVEYVTVDGKQQVVKTYSLAPGQDPVDIPRDSFVRDGDTYVLTDITESRSSSVETIDYVETIEIETETKDINDIMQLVEMTIDFKSEDGFEGTLTLDIASIHCEPDTYGYGKKTLSTTRTYPNLSAADTSIIPKTVQHENSTLELDSVSWNVHHYNNVDYEEIPDIYDAVGYYSAVVPTSWVKTYITTADYTGEVTRTVIGPTLFKAFFDVAEPGTVSINVIDAQDITKDSAPAASNNNGAATTQQNAGNTPANTNNGKDTMTITTTPAPAAKDNGLLIAVIVMAIVIAAGIVFAIMAVAANKKKTNSANNRFPPHGA